MAEAGQAVRLADLVERPGMECEGDRSSHPEQPGRHRDAQRPRERQFGHRESSGRERAPVGIGDRQVRHLRDPRADREREPEIADDHVRTDLVDQGEVVGHVRLERRGVIDRAARGERGQKLARGNRADRAMIKPSSPPGLAEARLGGEDDLVTGRVEPSGQRERSSDMRQRHRLRDEEDSSPQGSSLGISSRVSGASRIFETSRSGRVGKSMSVGGASRTGSSEPPREDDGAVGFDWS